MTRHIHRTILLVITALIVSSLPARAQNAPVGVRSDRGTELGLFVGATATSARTGATIAGTVGWQLTRWVDVEARGAWFDRGSGSDGFGADVGALVIVPGTGVAPYVGIAFGLYRAAFDSANSPMSNFYRRRMAPGGAGPMDLTFTDPALRITAGLDILTGRHVTVRPEASALFVRREGRGETMAIVGIRIGYRFADRPITPSPTE